MHHGIVIDQSFKDRIFLEGFKVFNKKQDEDWGIYGIEVEDSQLEEAIKKIQENMAEGTWYVHFYNEEDLIVVFKDKVFNVINDPSTWEPIKEYGRGLNIPEDQLNIYPCKFQDENNYFST